MIIQVEETRTPESITINLGQGTCEVAFQCKYKNVITNQVIRSWRHRSVIRDIVELAEIFNGEQLRSIGFLMRAG